MPSGYSVNLIDYDNDGWPDLPLAEWLSGPMPDRLYHAITPVHRCVEEERCGRSRPGFVSLWGDLDNGWLDPVVANGVLQEGSVT